MNPPKRIILLLAAIAAVAIISGHAAEPPLSPVAPKAEEFPLSDVRLDSSSPFYKAMMIDRHYLMSLDYDRLLSHMRKAAGLQPKAPPMGAGRGNPGRSATPCRPSRCSTPPLGTRRCWQS